MSKRRDFLRLSALATTGILLSKNKKYNPTTITKSKAVVIATWDHGIQSNKVSWDILKSGGSALDAVEKGVRVVESDASGTSVGIGGAPDRDGRVTLDACIMNHKQQCGSVGCIENIENPISVARKVMEDTPHVMLVGEGAYKFAIEKGFKHKNLLTPASKVAWKHWLKNSQYKPIINVENHDTIGSLALDTHGNLSGACTTSGLAYKMHGRVGDSPIIGAGLFVDNNVGAACATGLGEAVIRNAGSAMVVELMRHGSSPEEACKEVVERIIRTDMVKNIQVGFLALSKDGKYGSYAIQKGFNYALNTFNKSAMINSNYINI